MNNNELLKTLNEIETLVVSAKSMLGSTATAHSHIVKRRRSSKVKSRKTGSTAPITKMVDEKFFDRAKSDLEVVEGLRKKALKFDRNDIAVTLMRFVRKGILVREGNGKDKPWRYKKA